MVILERFKDAGTLAKAAFVALLVAALFVWIAFTCPGWGGYRRKTLPYERSGKHFGLWRYCSDDKYSPSCTDLDGWALEWFMAFQAFVTFGLLGINLGLFLVTLYIFVPSCQRHGELGKVAAVVCCAAAGLYMIGVIIFGVRYRRDYIDNEELSRDYIYGYCFGLSIVAILLDGTSGVLMFLDSRLNGRTSTETQQLIVATPSCQVNPTYGVHSGSQEAPVIYSVPSSNQKPPAGFQASTGSNQQEEETPNDKGSAIPNADA